MDLLAGVITARGLGCLKVEDLRPSAPLFRALLLCPSRSPPCGGTRRRLCPACHPCARALDEDSRAGAPASTSAGAWPTDGLPGDLAMGGPRRRQDALLLRSASRLHIWDQPHAVTYVQFATRL